VIDERLYQKHEREQPEHRHDQSDREDGKKHAHDRSFLLRAKVLQSAAAAIGVGPDRRSPGATQLGKER
jgi:hypothetical protein